MMKEIPLAGYPKLKSTIHDSYDPHRPAAAVSNLHGQGDDCKSSFRELIQLRHVFQGRDVLVAERHVGFEPRRLAIVDAGGVDANRLARPLLHQPLGGSGVKTGEVKLFNGLRSLLLSSQISR